MLENKDQITLDSANNVFVGPNGYFKIVIDKFDGTKVSAWHIEDSKGNKTGNLARGEGKHIDVLISRANGTVGQFVGKAINALYDYSQAQLAKLQGDMTKAQADLTKTQAATTDTQKSLTEKDDAIKRANDAAKTVQDKAAQLEKTVTDLQAKQAARASYVDPMVPVAIAVAGVLALVGLYFAMRRKPA